MKRVVSLILVLALVFSCVIGISAASGTAPMMTVGSISGAQGEKVELTVTLKNNPGISSAIMEIDYDITRLTLVDVTIGEKFSTGAYSNINLPYVTFVRSGDIVGDEVLLVLSFAINSKAKEGDAYVTVLYEEGDITNYDEEDVNFEVVPGTVTVTSERNPFDDVKKGDFFYDPVLWAVDNGITNGATPTMFDPNGTCLRAHVVTFLHRAAGNPDPTSSKNPFADVNTSDFFYKPVLWAVEKGITNGTSANTFGSYANCNRAAVVTFLWRAAGSPEPESTNNPFADVKTTDFFYKPVLWAAENKITSGIDATHFGPTADCNRAQVVTFLYRAYN